MWTGSCVYKFETSVSPAKTEDPYDFEHLANNLIVVGACSRNSIRRLYVDSGAVSMKLSNELPGAGPHQLPKDQLTVRVLAGENAGLDITSTHELSVRYRRILLRRNARRHHVGRDGVSRKKLASFAQRI
jgi:hypothetical protein